jgi:hypothetical protein
MGIGSYNPSASLNASLGSIPVGEGMLRQDVSDAFRQLMADIAAGVVPSVNVKAFGAKGDGATNDIPAILAAMNSLDATGGVVLLPPGVYAISDELGWGDGTNTTQSTKHSRIRLIGAGRGSTDEVTNTQSAAVTTIRYIGATDPTKAVINLKGPIHTLEISDLELDANSKAGYGLIVNHVTDSVFHNVVVRRWTTNSYLLTTRSTTPTGVAYGCGNNSFYDCFAYHPASNAAGGVKLDSGYSTAGNPTLDSANNDFRGGVYFYGGSTGSYGVHLHGADNNTFKGCQFLAAGGNDGGGKSVFFEQWPGNTQWPHENHISNCGMSQAIGGTSGTGGNIIDPLCTSDGTSVPAIANVHIRTYDGKEYVSGTRIYRVRQIQNFVTQTPQSTSVTSYADMTGYSITLTTLASKLRVRAYARATKFAAGTGNIMLNINGSDYGETFRDCGATGFYHSLAAETIVDVTAGSQTVKLRFQSSDTNAFTVDRGTLIVEELY